MKIYETLFSFIAVALLSNKEGPTYSVIMKHDNYQLRRYNQCIVAETTVSSTHDDAGNEAFHILAGYIFGKNQEGTKIEMTAPVTEFQVSPGKYTVQFFMPAKWTLETLPKPLDGRITLKKLDPRTLFVVRYHGGWSERHYERENQSVLRQAENLNIRLKNESQPIWARYNSPMAPAPVRTNEVMYEVRE